MQRPIDIGLLISTNTDLPNQTGRSSLVLGSSSVKLSVAARRLLVT